MKILDRIRDVMFAPYCSECGARCTMMCTGYYNTHTGKSETIYACPTRLKGHHGMNDCRLRNR